MDYDSFAFFDKIFDELVKKVNQLHLRLSGNWGTARKQLVSNR